MSQETVTQEITAAEREAVQAVVTRIHNLEESALDEAIKVAEKVARFKELVSGFAIEHITKILDAVEGKK